MLSWEQREQIWSTFAFPLYLCFSYSMKAQSCQPQHHISLLRCLTWDKYQLCSKMTPSSFATEARHNWIWTKGRDKQSKGTSISIFKSLVFVFSSLLDLNCQIYCICVSVCICITMQVGQWIWTKGRSKGEIVVRWDRQFDADLINIRWKYKYLNTKGEIVLTQNSKKSKQKLNIAHAWLQQGQNIKIT